MGRVWVLSKGFIFFNFIFFGYDGKIMVFVIPSKVFHTYLLTYLLTYIFPLSMYLLVGLPFRLFTNFHVCNTLVASTHIFVE